MKNTDELPENVVYNEHVVRAYFSPVKGSEDYKAMDKFINDWRNGVVYRCPENIVDQAYHDFILLCSLKALDERWMFKEN